MQGWLDLDYVRARCAQLRAEAARMRLARMSHRARSGAARRRIARTLLALGTMFVAAGKRVGGDARLAN